MGGIEVSIIVACYNPNWEKLKKTIISLIKQKDVITEIIVCDDGSQKNYFEQVQQLFYLYNYKNYTLLDSCENMGTCFNVKKGLDKSCGEFIKVISPGDYLFSDTCLSEWYEFNKNNNVDVSFCDAVYYSETDNGKIEFLSCLAAPQYVELYALEGYSKKKAILDYLFLKDAVVGANFLVESSILKKYINIIVGKIKYAEDMAFRIMICDDVEIVHYPHEAIWYEHGTGISTSGSSKWKKIIYNEKQISNELIIHTLENKHTILDKRIIVGIKAISNKRYAMLKYVIFPELVIMKVNKDRKNRRTNINYAMRQFEIITHNSVEVANASD